MKAETLPLFKTKKPVSIHHYLVLPRGHCYTLASLDERHCKLIKEMETFGRKCIEDRVVNLCERQLSIGFRRGLRFDQKHLHMHVIYPYSDIPMWARGLYNWKLANFYTPNELIEQIQKIKYDDCSPCGETKKNCGEENPCETKKPCGDVKKGGCGDK